MRPFSIAASGIFISLASVLSGLTPSPAGASVPSNGNYVCATGLPASISDTTNLFKITNGMVLPLGSGCSGEVVIPDGVTAIGPYAFFLSSITSVAIPETVTSIGVGAFSSITTLASITIPASVTTIDQAAFYKIESLTAFTVDENNPNFTSNSGVLFNKSATTLINYPIGNSMTEYIIPMGVETIGESAFESADALTSVTIPSSVVSIEDYVFVDATALTSFYFLGNAPTVYDFVFFNIGSSPKAYIRSSATGFGADGGTWNDLTVVYLYTVSHDSKGGSAVSDGTFAAGGSVTAPAEPTLNGFTFGGWSNIDGGSVVTFPYSPGVITDITLYAKWTANTYAVTFNSKGGSSVSDGAFFTGGSIAEPITPTRDGFIFDGWSNVDGGSVVTFPYSPGVTTDITLYAKWTAVAAPTSTTTSTSTSSPVDTEPVTTSTSAPTSLPPTGSDRDGHLFLIALLLFGIGLITRRLNLSRNQ